jgi:hypothetical protein
VPLKGEGLRRKPPRSFAFFGGLQLALEHGPLHAPVKESGERIDAKSKKPVPL